MPEIPMVWCVLFSFQSAFILLFSRELSFQSAFILLFSRELWRAPVCNGAGLNEREQ